MRKKPDGKNDKVVVEISREMNDEMKKVCLRQNLSTNDFVQKAIAKCLESIKSKQIANEVFRLIDEAMKKGGSKSIRVGPSKKGGKK